MTTDPLERIDQEMREQGEVDRSDATPAEKVEQRAAIREAADEDLDIGGERPDRHRA